MEKSRELGHASLHREIRGQKDGGGDCAVISTAAREVATKMALKL
jgi:hypothetical protein